MEQLAEELGRAIEAAVKALLALLLALAILVTRASQAVFTLARLALPVGAAALQAVGAVMLFGSVVVAYGGDFPALLLALASVVVVPVALVLLARGVLDIWGILFASGALSLVVYLVIGRVPPTLLGALPGVGLSACIFYLTFGCRSNAREVNSE